MPHIGWSGTDLAPLPEPLLSRPPDGTKSTPSGKMRVSSAAETFRRSLSAMSTFAAKLFAMSRSSGVPYEVRREGAVSLSIAYWFFRRKIRDNHPIDSGGASVFDEFGFPVMENGVV